MSNQMEGQAAQEPHDPRPILWVVGSSFDRRADMLWENRPCRDLDKLIEVVRSALDRGATEITIRDFAFSEERRLARIV